MPQPRSRMRLPDNPSPAAAALAVLVLATVAVADARAEPATLLRSATVDLAARTVTLPLHFGRMASGEGVWYVLLDTDDAGAAERLGINHSAKLANAAVGRAVREAEIAPDGALVFENGTVDLDRKSTRLNSSH